MAFIPGGWRGLKFAVDLTLHLGAALFACAQRKGAFLGLDFHVEKSRSLRKLAQPTIQRLRKHYLRCRQRFNKSGNWHLRASLAFHLQLRQEWQHAR